MNIGIKIKKIRKDNKISLDALAKKSGLCKSYLWAIENKPSNPTLDKLQKISNALSVTVDYLVGEELNVTERVIKDVFFSKFNNLSDTNKYKIEKIIDILIS